MNLFLLQKLTRLRSKYVKGIKGEYWTIPTVKYQSWKHKRRVRDLIKSKVKKLIEEFG